MKFKIALLFETIYKNNVNYNSVLHVFSVTVSTRTVGTDKNLPNTCTRVSTAGGRGDNYFLRVA